MIKKIISLIAVVAVLAVPTAFASEPKEAVLVKNAFTVKVDGEYITSDTYYDNEKGDVYLPLRAIFETFGATVSWNGETNLVNIVSGGEKSAQYKGEYTVPTELPYKTEIIYPDSVILNYNGDAVTADTFILDGRTYISSSTIEALTGHTYADSSTGTVRLYSEDYKALENDTAAVYGDNKTMNYEQFFDLAKFLYGNVETAAKYGFKEIDSYLIYNIAVDKVSNDTKISVSNAEVTDFALQNNISAAMEERKIEDTEFFNSVVVKDYALREKIVAADKKELYNPTEEELKAWYGILNESKGVWLKAQHILVSKDESGENLKKAQALLEEAKKKDTDFTELMLKNSEDPGSQTNPEGYIFTEGQMVESFYNGALNLKPGEISEIVESEYGYHIIKKIAHWENGIPFEEIKDDIKASYNEKLFSESLIEYAVNSDVFYLKDNIVSKYNEKN